MGFGLPVSIGAALACPERQVVCFSGDGSLMVNALLAKALGEKGPCLIHAPVDSNEKVYPMVPPGAANKDMIGGDSRVEDSI